MKTEAQLTVGKGMNWTLGVWLPRGRPSSRCPEFLVDDSELGERRKRRFWFSSGQNVRVGVLGIDARCCSRLKSQER